MTSRRARNRRDKRIPLPANLDAMLTNAYAAGREDEHFEMTLDRLIAEGEEYQREQIASANSGTDNLNGPRG